jgi:outer membrane protein OmpA-like peptidoglycan-associated protein/outer membrane protein W
MKRLLMLGLLIAVAAGPASAQIDDAGRWGLGLEYGAWKMIGGDHDYSTREDFGAFHIRRGLSPAISMDLGFKFGSFRPGAAVPGEDVEFESDATSPLHTRTWQPALTFIYHIVPDGHWRPWVSAGVGVTRWDVLDTSGEESIGWWPEGDSGRVFNEDGESVEGHGVNVTALLGIGLDYAFSDNWSVGFAARTNVLFNQDRDNIGLAGDPREYDPAIPGTGWGPEHVDANTQIIEATLGLRSMFGGAEEEVAPVVAAAAVVADRDFDGILDDVDACPDQAEDKDGFEDADGCPDPDNDGDGVLDAADRCPDQLEDKDGFEDADGCPDPDNDGDGVLDAADLCPNTPKGVQVDASGCPVVKEIKAALILEGVTFASNSAEISPNAAKVLDEVSASLLAWPNVNIEIGGHTDSSGNDELNKKLSQARADSVRDYLVGKGVAAERITAVGYGEAKPIADNGTADGKRINRRVEVTRTN